MFRHIHKIRRKCLFITNGYFHSSWFGKSHRVFLLNNGLNHCQHLFGDNIHRIKCHENRIIGRVNRLNTTIFFRCQEQKKPEHIRMAFARNAFSDRDQNGSVTGKLNVRIIQSWAIHGIAIFPTAGPDNLISEDILGSGFGDEGSLISRGRKLDGKSWIMIIGGLAARGNNTASRSAPGFLPAPLHDNIES